MKNLNTNVNNTTLSTTKEDKTMLNTNVNLTKNDIFVNNPEAVELIHSYATQSKFRWGDKAVPVGCAFGDGPFERWVMAAIAASYEFRLPWENGQRPADCPYGLVKKAAQTLARSWQKEMFNDALVRLVDEEAVAKAVIEDHKNGGFKARANDFSEAPEWLDAALDEVQPLYDKITLSFAAYTYALFGGSGRRVKELQTPSMNFTMKPGHDGKALSEWFEDAVNHKDDIDAVELLRYRAWKNLRVALLRRLSKELGLADDTKTLACWSKVLRTVAEGRMAYGDIKLEVVETNGRNRTIVTEGWNTSRMEWLEKSVYSDNAYAGDPREYDAQLAQQKEFERTYLICEDVYEEYKDLVEALCKQSTNEGELDPINMSIRLYTKVPGLWDDMTKFDDGSVQFHKDFETMEDAMKAAKVKRIHEQAAYYREREESVYERAEEIFKQMGWE